MPSERWSSGLIAATAVATAVVMGGLLWYVTRPTEVSVRIEPTLATRSESLSVVVQHGSAAPQIIVAAPAMALSDRDSIRHFGPATLEGHGEATLRVAIGNGWERREVAVSMPYGASYEWLITLGSGTKPELTRGRYRGRSGVTSLPLPATTASIGDTLWITWEAHVKPLPPLP